jgi:hypothetical protein
MAEGGWMESASLSCSLNSVPHCTPTSLPPLEHLHAKVKSSSPVTVEGVGDICQQEIRRL